MMGAFLCPDDDGANKEGIRRKESTGKFDCVTSKAQSEIREKGNPKRNAESKVEERSSSRVEGR